MKVLYLLPGKYFESRTGGCVSHSTGVVDALAGMGHQVSLCSSDMIPGYRGNIDFYPLTIKGLSLRFFGRVYRDHLIYRQLRKVLASVRPELVYIRWRQNIFWKRLLSDRSFKAVFECNTPSTLSLYKYGSRPGRLKGSFTRHLDRQICLNSDIISAVSSGVKDFLVEEIGCPAEKVLVNPNGVDTEIFTPAGENMRAKYGLGDGLKVIGYSGSFRPQHGIEVLIRAFKMLEDADVRLLIIGAGEKKYEEDLRKIAEDDSRIIFTGEVPFSTMPAHLRTCDILISPQVPYTGRTFHQSPIKLYEYMAAGRAIAASDLGQIRQVIDDGRNGLLFKSGDPGSLKGCLLRMVRDRDLMDRLAANARDDAVALYSWKNNINRIFSSLNLDF